MLIKLNRLKKMKRTLFDYLNDPRLIKTIESSKRPKIDFYDFAEYNEKIKTYSELEHFLSVVKEKYLKVTISLSPDKQFCNFYINHKLFSIITPNTIHKTEDFDVDFRFCLFKLSFNLGDLINKYSKELGLVDVSDPFDLIKSYSQLTESFLASLIGIRFV